MLIGIIIPTFQAEKWIRNCLESLQNSCITSCRIYVVDNASLDQTTQIVTHDFPQAILIRNIRNMGFAAAVNIGLRAAIDNGCDYGVLLNQDMCVPEDWLHTLVTFVMENPSAIYSALELTYDGSKIEPTACRNLCEQAPDFLDDLLLREVKDRYRIYNAFGGCLALPRDILDRIGFFDENFIMYCEDIDYCRRATRAGVEIWFLPEWRVRHKSTMTSQGGYSDPRINRHNRRGWIMLALKDPARPYWKSFLATVKSTGKALISSALRFDSTTVRETFSDLAWLMVNRRSILAARTRDNININQWPAS